MASPRGVPPMLEEALGLGLTPGSETEEAVSADGAYYLERILTGAGLGPARRRRSKYRLLCSQEEEGSLLGRAGPHTSPRYLGPRVASQVKELIELSFDLMVLNKPLSLQNQMFRLSEISCHRALKSGNPVCPTQAAAGSIVQLND